MTTDAFGATELALSAARADAGDPSRVGALIAIESEQGEIATYLFESLLPGYRGWRWAVTVTKVDGDEATVCDVVLLPGPDSLLAPKWIPYGERLQKGDLGVGDIVPTERDDARLTPGYSVLPEDEDLDILTPDLIWEMGIGRARVLSIEGRDQASKRWYEGENGPNAEIAKAAPLPCHSCGFFVPIAGSLRRAFGVCANAISPQDGRVVSVDHGCGAHSEVLV
ncbi:MAG: DUF3027 domain-containing protein [Candidatus Nanopelagicaceae bacterium]